jgi:LPS sulfotransferase NodH
MNRSATSDGKMRAQPGGKRKGLLQDRAAKPIHRLADRRLDFPRSVALRKSYIVASTDRSGSTFLCSLLWRTGVLGAPAEYWNYRSRPGAKPIGTQMMERLNASSPADYLEKLLACRTSKNGVFGVKAHSFDFKEVLRKFPKLLELLAPVTYVYIQRQDKVAQAVSMAKATQTGAWVAQAKSNTANLNYDRDLISKCLNFLERQDLDWMQWFEKHHIDPFVVVYEKLISDPTSVVRGILEFMGVEGDPREEVHPPDLEKQGDETNLEWVERFRQESPAAVGPGTSKASPAVDVAARNRAPKGDAAVSRAEASHVFDRYDEVRDSAARPVDAKRLRHRYEAIINGNRELFRNARVLNIHSGDGRWSYAALNAGAAHVVGVDSERAQVELARNIFAELRVNPGSYEFVTGEILAALRPFRPESFDVVLCQEFAKLPDPHLFFQRLNRLRPKHIVLDTAVIAGKVPMISFRLKEPDKTATNPDVRSAAIRAVPNHELIRILCDYFDFRWRLIDWRRLGITDWTGIHDYEGDRHRTYILDRAA